MTNAWIWTNITSVDLLGESSCAIVKILQQAINYLIKPLTIVPRTDIINRNSGYAIWCGMSNHRFQGISRQRQQVLALLFRHNREVPGVQAQYSRMVLVCQFGLSFNNRYGTEQVKSLRLVFVVCIVGHILRCNQIFLQQLTGLGFNHRRYTYCSGSKYLQLRKRFGGRIKNKAHLHFIQLKVTNFKFHKNQKTGLNNNMCQLNNCEVE